MFPAEYVNMQMVLLLLATRAVECGSAYIFVDPDPAAFLMRIRIRNQPNKICNKLPYEELKKITIAQKLKHH